MPQKKNGLSGLDTRQAVSNSISANKDSESSGLVGIYRDSFDELLKDLNKSTNLLIRSIGAEVLLLALRTMRQQEAR